MVKSLTLLESFLYKKNFKLGAFSRPHKKTLKELKKIASRYQLQFLNSKHIEDTLDPIFIIYKKLNSYSFFNEDVDYFEYTPMINSVIVKKDNIKEIKEFCPSLPGFYYKNQRAYEIQVFYNDAKFKNLSATFKGNFAYQIQMNIDISDGLHFLNLDRRGHNDLEIYEPYKDLFQNTIHELQTFNQETKLLKYDNSPKYYEDLPDQDMSILQSTTAQNFQNQKLIECKAYKDFMNSLYFDYSEIQAMKESQFLSKVDKKYLHPKENPSLMYKLIKNLEIQLQ